MAVVWKVLVGMLLTLPAGAYVAGTIVGPYETSTPSQQGQISPTGPQSPKPALGATPAALSPAPPPPEAVIPYGGPATQQDAASPRHARPRPGSERTSFGPEPAQRQTQADRPAQEISPSAGDTSTASPTPSPSSSDTSSPSPSDTSSPTPSDTTSDAPSGTDSGSSTTDGSGATG
jgi:hypothetical protein